MNLQLFGDNRLVALYCNGNNDALAELIDRHKDRVFTTILVFVRDPVLAEDIFQDTFMKVIDTLRKGKYIEEGKFLPWVLRIAHNLCVDYFRRIKRTPKIVDKTGRDIFTVLKFADDTADGDFTRSETSQQLRDLLNQLPDEQREVVILRHFGDLSFKEIAEITNVSINTALGRMRYALVNMRRMIVERQIVL